MRIPSSSTHHGWVRKHHTGNTERNNNTKRKEGRTNSVSTAVALLYVAATLCHPSSLTPGSGWLGTPQHHSSRGGQRGRGAAGGCSAYWAARLGWGAHRGYSLGGQQDRQEWRLVGSFSSQWLPLTRKEGRMEGGREEGKKEGEKAAFFQLIQEKNSRISSLKQVLAPGGKYERRQTFLNPKIFVHT